uniref:Uncharacterized protein n=1 Tax=Arundo donax TaxID=35708 RepID=A0A0A9E0K1_ARUDO
MCLSDLFASSSLSFMGSSSLYFLFFLNFMLVSFSLRFSSLVLYPLLLLFKSSKLVSDFQVST